MGFPSSVRYAQAVIESSASGDVQVEGQLQDLGRADAAINSALNTHTQNTGIHVNSSEKNTWNSKANGSDLTNHTSNTTVHVNATEKSNWNSKANATHNHAYSSLTGIPTSFTPASHASSGTSYGAASDTQYGHVMVNSSTSNTSTTVAASASAVKAVYDLVMNSSEGGIYANPLKLGNGAIATGNDSIAIGHNSNGHAIASIAIGAATSATVSGAIAIGDSSSALNATTIALGPQANATGYSAITIGYMTNATNDNTIAIGGFTKALSPYAIAIGREANGSNYNAIAIGYWTKVAGNSSIAIGDNSAANGNYSLAIGSWANTPGARATAVGEHSYSADDGASLGAYAVAYGTHATALGASSNVYGAHAIGIGEWADANVAYAISIGYMTNCTGVNSVSLGYYAKNPNANSIQLGNSSKLSGLYCKVALTTQSDERDKINITDIEDSSVKFLKSIRAIRYLANPRAAYHYEDDVNDATGEITPNPLLTDEMRELRSKYGLYGYDKEAHARGDKRGSRVRVGVIAQEVQKALKEVYGDASYGNLVNDNLFDFDPDTIPDDVESQLGVTYENFIPFLIKAVQELDARITDNTEEISALTKLVKS